MKLWVYSFVPRSSERKLFPIEVEDGASVDLLKQTITETAGIPFEKVSLTFASTKLQEGSLLDLGISEGKTIHLFAL